MTRMTPLLERNEQFASTYTPAAQLIVAGMRVDAPSTSCRHAYLRRMARWGESQNGGR
jgi:hypothetical protein